jgi:fumarylacetoacetate (FAA) hydrolase family protein
MTWKTEIDHHGILPKDWPHGCLVGRVWRPDIQGPSVVVVRDGTLLDISEVFPTMRDLCETQEPAASVAAISGEPVGAIDEIVPNSPPDRRDPRKPWLLAPIDLQAVKAAGVTFAVSLLERVIEEQARGNPQASASIRNEIVSSVGHALGQLKPGSPQASSLKELLIQIAATLAAGSCIPLKTFLSILRKCNSGFGEAPPLRRVLKIGTPSH